MKLAGHVFRKELRELMRDKRVFYGAFVGPIFLILLMLQLFTMVEKAFTKPGGLKVHVVRTAAEPSIIAKLKKDKTLQVVYVSSVSEGEKLVRDGAAKAVLHFEEGYDQKLANGVPVKIEAIFDKDEVKAQVILGRVGDAIAKDIRARLESILGNSGIPRAMAEPIKLEMKPIEKPEEGVGSTLAGFLPYLIVLWAFYGAMTIAADLIAGEKERQTLETLLISPASRREIALGKFLALSMVGLSSSLSSLLAVLIMGLTSGSSAKLMFPNGVSISPAAIFAILAVIIPLVAMFAGLLLAISAYARNTREAQSYLTLVSFLVLMPAIFSQFIGFTDFAKAQWVSFVPVLNSATVLREALLGNLNPVSLAITVGLSFALAAIAIWAAVRMFNREQVLVRV
jgi:sodium transport system permease protein